MSKKIPWAELLVALLVLAAGAALFAWAHRDEGEIEESKRRGAAIVAALASYDAAHGTYPDSLSRLVPDYVARIEAPSWGVGRWHYRRYSPGDTTAMFFQLSVAADESGYPLLYYDIASGDWVLTN